MTNISNKEKKYYFFVHCCATPLKTNDYWNPIQQFALNMYCCLVTKKCFLVWLLKIKSQRKLLCKRERGITIFFRITAIETIFWVNRNIIRLSGQENWWSSLKEFPYQGLVARNNKTSHLEVCSMTKCYCFHKHYMAKLNRKCLGSEVPFT